MRRDEGTWPRDVSNMVNVFCVLCFVWGECRFCCLVFCCCRVEPEVGGGSGARGSVMSLQC